MKNKLKMVALLVSVGIVMLMCGAGCAAWGKEGRESARVETIYLQNWVDQYQKHNEGKCDPATCPVHDKQ